MRWKVNVDALMGATELLHHIPQPHDSLVTQVPVGQPQNMSNTIPYKQKTLRFLSIRSTSSTQLPTTQSNLQHVTDSVACFSAGGQAEKHSLSKYSPSKAQIRMST